VADHVSILQESTDRNTPTERAPGTSLSESFDGRVRPRRIADESLTADELLSLAASVQGRSEHHLVVRPSRKPKTAPSTSPTHLGFSRRPGKERADVDNGTTHIENRNYVKTVLEELDVYTLAVSLGGTESLVDHPATMSASYLSDAEREAAGIPDSLIRIPVGIEHIDDLIADIEQALANL
jgi:hypothetical protein